MKILLPWFGTLFLFLAILDQNRDVLFWKNETTEWKAIAKKANDVSDTALDQTEKLLVEMTNLVNQVKVWQDAAILCAKAVGVEIEVIGPTNVVITVPPKPFIKL